MRTLIMAIATVVSLVAGTATTVRAQALTWRDGALAAADDSALLAAEGCEGWAIPHVSAAHVRTEPRHGAELATQALMGWPLRVLSRLSAKGWSYVELPDGYRGYVIDNSLTFVDAGGLRRWLDAPRAIAVGVMPAMGCDATGEAVADFVQGDIAEVVGRDARTTQLRLPDGREARLPSGACLPLDQWQQLAPDPQRILATARALMGVPYLWGGLTAKGMDCSGLTRLAYLAEGILLPRDASQQVAVGRKVAADEAALAPADLLFFASSSGRINHVALYAGDGMMIEAAGRVRLSPVPWQKVVAARRLLTDLADSD